MPIIKSAAKRMRQNSKRATINNRYRKQMRDAIKQVTTDVANGDKKSASANLSLAQKAIDKAVKQGILHKNTASRRKARLAKLVESTSSKSATKTTAKKPAKKAPAKKTPAKKTATKKAPAKKPATKKTATKKAPAKKPATKKSTKKSS